MNIDLRISCLRCTASTSLDAPAAKKDASGNWVAVSTKRPEGWIAGSAPGNEIDKGLCPACAPEWTALQEKFLTTPPANPDIELKHKPITITPKATGNIPTFVKETPSTHIAVRDEAPPRTTSIPMQASVVEAPQQAMNAPAPAPIQQALHMRGVKVEPIRTMATSVPAARVTQVHNPAQNVRVSSLAMPNSPATIVQGVAASVPATRIQRILPAETPVEAAPVLTASLSAPPQNTYNVVKSEPAKAPTRNIQILGPAVHAPAAAPGSVVSTSAPVPIPPPAGMSGSVVSISEPVPIERK